VLPWQVKVAFPRTEQEPVQVMLQVPEVHETLEPAPTAWVHPLPEHETLQLAPQLPEQVASAAQL